MDKMPIKILLFVIFTGGFVALFFTVPAGPFLFDQPVQDFIISLRSETLTKVFEFITFFADTETIIVICAVLLFIPFTRISIGIPVTLGTGIAGLCKQLLKGIVERPRPDQDLWLVQESGFSFPSGHATGSIVFYIILGLLCARYLFQKRKYGQGYVLMTVVVIGIIAIGISRIYLGVHYPTDILGGWCLGSALLIVFMTAYDAFYPPNYKLTGK
jgi:undecaprenyl-diphosphatase